MLSKNYLSKLKYGEKPGILTLSYRKIDKGEDSPIQSKNSQKKYKISTYNDCNNPIHKNSSINLSKTNKQKPSSKQIQTNKTLNPSGKDLQTDVLNNIYNQQTDSQKIAFQNFYEKKKLKENSNDLWKSDFQININKTLNKNPDRGGKSIGSPRLPDNTQITTNKLNTPKKSPQFNYKDQTNGIITDTSGVDNNNIFPPERTANGLNISKNIIHTIHKPGSKNPKDMKLNQYEKFNDIIEKNKSSTPMNKKNSEYLFNSQAPDKKLFEENNHYIKKSYNDNNTINSSNYHTQTSRDTKIKLDGEKDNIRNQFENAVAINKSQVQFSPRKTFLKENCSDREIDYQKISPSGQQKILNNELNKMYETKNSNNFTLSKQINNRNNNHEANCDTEPNKKMWLDKFKLNLQNNKQNQKVKSIKITDKKGSDSPEAKSKKKGQDPQTTSKQPNNRILENLGIAENKIHDPKQKPKKFGIELTPTSNIDTLFHRPKLKNNSIKQKWFKDIETFPKMREEIILGKVMGKGSFANVYNCYDKKKAQNCAVKIYHKLKLNDPARRGFVQSEIDVFSEQIHPNIVEYYRTFEDEKSVYILQEKFGHKSLSAYIAGSKDGRIYEHEARFLFTKFISSIAYMHKKRIAHRDQKLTNILIEIDQKTGKAEELKIIDFGFAEINPGLSRICCGTPSYMAPELMQKNEYDPFEVDLWAIGVVIFRMVTGSYPFGSDKEQTLSANVNNCYVKYPTYLSRACKRLIQSCQQVEPKNRQLAKDIALHEWVIEEENSPRSNYQKSHEEEVKVVYGAES